MIKKNSGHIGGIIEGFIKKLAEGSAKRANSVTSAWIASTEKETQRNAAPVSLKNGVLIVLVENSTWMYKLMLEKRELLKNINENYAGRKKIKDIRFRVGTMNG